MILLFNNLFLKYPYIKKIHPGFAFYQFITYCQTNTNYQLIILSGNN